MKPFNLEEYLKNPKKKIITGDGRSARIICTNRRDLDFPIVALIAEESRERETAQYYTRDGKFCMVGSYEYDLFFVPEKHEGWVNIYKNERDYYFWKFIYPKKTDAEAVADSTCIATVKIEWEE